MAYRSINQTNYTSSRHITFCIVVPYIYFVFHGENDMTILSSIICYGHHGVSIGHRCIGHKSQHQWTVSREVNNKRIAGDRTCTFDGCKIIIRNNNIIIVAISYHKSAADVVVRFIGVGHVMTAINFQS